MYKATVFGTLYRDATPLTMIALVNAAPASIATVLGIV